MQILAPNKHLFGTKKAHLSIALKHYVIFKKIFDNWILVNYQIFISLSVLE